MTLEYLQNYWWVLISVLGGALVFMLFVLGGQSMLLECRREVDRNMIVNCMGRKWELTFTTLVVFGGAFFASFPLFYSTSFGGAYWLWMLILFSFILQAVSYEFRRKPGNILGTRTFDIFLFVNGCAGCVLLGVAVSMFFFGAEFTVSKGNLLDSASPVISQWAPTHGFEAIFNWKNLILGVAVLFLARTLACLYMMNSIDDDNVFLSMRQRTFVNGGIFVVFFLWFMAQLLTSDGYSCYALGNGKQAVELTAFKYFHNYVNAWWAGVLLLGGVVAVLYGVIRSAFSDYYTYGIWWAGIGTFAVVVSLFFVAGFCDTAYYPSLLDAQSSLTIRNSSSSEFTLEVMAWVSALIPFVLMYISVAWGQINERKITSDEIKKESHY